MAFSQETGDRMAWTKIEQLINQKYEVVGYYDQRTNNLTWNVDSEGLLLFCNKDLLVL